MLYQLSYIGTQKPSALSAQHSARELSAECFLERETGIEPATNSLEGCDSTTELLPPPTSVTSAKRRVLSQHLDAAAWLARPLSLVTAHCFQVVDRGGFEPP